MPALFRIDIGLKTVAISIIAMFLLIDVQDLLADEKPKLDLRIFRLPETKACAPNGYLNYSDGKVSKCQPFDQARISKFLEDGYQVLHEMNLPPGTITLNDDVRLKISNYAKLVKNNPSLSPHKRAAILFLFENEKGFHGTVELSRKSGEKATIVLRKIENRIKPGFSI